MKTYKTPDALRLSLNERRRKIKEAGGPVYEALLAKERAERKKYRERHPEEFREHRKDRPFKTELVRRARLRGRKRGMEATVAVSDLVWPTHCPVLGIELFYPTRSKEGGDPNRQDRPSLDRWDNTKGYIPGNVFVISLRANSLKNNATAAELIAIAGYVTAGLSGCVVPKG